jgi:peptide chain release factor
MILLQISAAQGPAECALAVAKAQPLLQAEADRLGVKLSVLEMLEGDTKGTVKSLLCALEGDRAAQLADNWCGSFMWVCQSPYRANHKRKNWFFGGEVFIVAESPEQGEIDFQTCRASGAGGQHVNKTDSAVRAVHRQTGLSVRVESERSQHGNKRLAILLLNKKLAEQAQSERAKTDTERHRHHRSIERGNVKRSFKGADFKEQ